MEKKEWWIPEEDDTRFRDFFEEAVAEETVFNAAEIFFKLWESVTETAFVGETELFETGMVDFIESSFEEFPEEPAANLEPEGENPSPISAILTEKSVFEKESGTTEQGGMMFPEGENILEEAPFEKNFLAMEIPIKASMGKERAETASAAVSSADESLFIGGERDIDYEHLTELVYDRVLRRLRAELSGSGSVTG